VIEHHPLLLQAVVPAFSVQPLPEQPLPVQPLEVDFGREVSVVQPGKSAVQTAAAAANAAARAMMMMVIQEQARVQLLAVQHQQMLRVQFGLFRLGGYLA
jgi:hypothetical protein